MGKVAVSALAAPWSLLSDYELLIFDSFSLSLSVSNGNPYALTYR